MPDLATVSVQAWPQDGPESQSRRSWSSKSQAPSEEVGHNKNVSPHTDVQVRVLMTEHLMRKHSHADTISAPSRFGSWCAGRLMHMWL